ncbi:MAG: CIA30 family protein [Lentisphaeria bacterium]|nr:hypothetical protein [Lentisphaerota bacterium]
MKYLLLLLVCMSAFALEPLVLEDFEMLEGVTKTGQQSSFKLTDQAAVGSGALEVTLPGTVSCRLSFGIPEKQIWNEYQGISFRVKGDGSDAWVPISLVSTQGSYSYVYFVPMKSTSWTTYKVGWDEFIPEAAVGLIGELGSLPPCGIDILRFGCRWTIWYDNAPIPKHTACFDHVQLEPVIDKNPGDFQPMPAGRFLTKLREGKPVLIQCQGDSVTAGTSLREKEKTRYSIQLQNILREWLGNEGITVLNKAVGGARANDLRAWINRDFNGETPDLVTVWIGYNDKSGAIAREYYGRAVNDYIDRVAQKTKGESAILLIATGPGKGPRFTMMDDFAEEIRKIAKDRKLLLFDVNNILKSLGHEDFCELMADMAHPNEAGHRMVAEKLADFLVEAAKITTPKPVKPQKPAPPKGQEYETTLEGDAENWKLEPQAEVTTELAQDNGKCLKLTAVENNPDHVRAWSTPINVISGQVYRIEADVLNKIAKGRYGIYIAEYSEGDGKGQFDGLSMHCVFAQAGNARHWTRHGSKYTVPEGIKSVRVLVWSSKDSLGTLYFDNLKVIPK